MRAYLWGWFPVPYWLGLRLWKVTTFEIGGCDYAAAA